MFRRDIKQWFDIAYAEASALIKSLPAPLRDRLSRISITFSGRPDKCEAVEDGDEYNLLGLFTGSPLCEGDADFELSPEIRIFVENIRDEVNGDKTEFRHEVRTTLLHEIGHYLGLG